GLKTYPRIKATRRRRPAPMRNLALTRAAGSGERRVHLGELVADVGLDRLGARHVDVSALDIALLGLAEAAAVERARIARIEREHLVEIGNGAVEFRELEEDVAAVGERVGIARLELDRLVAGFERLARLVGDRLGVAAFAPGKRIAALEPDCLIEIRKRAIIF